MKEPRITVFLPDYSTKQRDILGAFAHGVPWARIRSLSETYVPCDIAVIFGMLKHSYRETWVKRKVLEQHQGRRLIVIDSAFVKRGEYWNVGFGGINGNADFRTADVLNDRWQGLGVRSKPWRQQPYGPIVVCGQLPWDVAVQDVDHVQWVHDTIKWFKAQGETHIVFRPHPRLRDWQQRYRVDPTWVIDLNPLALTLSDARLFVTWNSNSAVDAAIQGVPVIAVDKGSCAYSLGNNTLESYKQLRCPSRREWLAGIGYSQWNMDELKQGLAWKHLSRGLEW